MQDFNKYLQELLFNHKSVILPGFGAFISNYKPAKHNTTNQIFEPPYKELFFNEKLSYNDGLLINYVAKLSGISYTKAEDFIKEEVQRLWLKLDKGEEVLLEGIGKFKYNNEKKIIFTQITEKNFLTDSYGLSSFRFPPLDYQKQAPHNVIPIHTTMNTKTKKIVGWSVAAVILIVAAIAVLIPNSQTLTRQEASISLINNNIEAPIEAIHSAVAEDTNVVNVIAQQTDKRTALFYTEQPPVIEKKQNTDSYIFYIIGASYKNKKNAIEHADFFREKGFDAMVLNTDGLYRVALCNFNNKINALHELRRIRKEEHNDKVWLYSQKK